MHLFLCLHTAEGVVKLKVACPCQLLCMHTVSKEMCGTLT